MADEDIMRRYLLIVGHLPIISAIDTRYPDTCYKKTIRLICEWELSAQIAVTTRNSRRPQIRRSCARPIGSGTKALSIASSSAASEISRLLQQSLAGHRRPHSCKFELRQQLISNKIRAIFSFHFLKLPFLPPYYFILHPLFLFNGVSAWNVVFIICSYRYSRFFNSQ